MDHYPAKFSPEARAAVEAELIRAGHAYDKKRRECVSDWSFPERQGLQTWILSVFLVYAREAIELGRAGVLTVDRVRAQALEGLRVITLEIGIRKNYQGFIERSWGSVTREAQHEFEASTEWRQFEDELLALAESLHKPPGNDARSHDNLPQLSDSKKRQLELKWSDLLDKYHLSGEHLQWHDKARLRRDASKLIDQIGIVPSTNVAELRFTGLAYAYWSIWRPSTPYEVFVDWLNAIRRWTSADLESVWKGKSDAIDAWYTKTCAPAIEKELDTRVREWTKKARSAELAYLERYPDHSSKADAAISQANHFQSGDGERRSPEVRERPSLAAVPARRGRPPKLSDDKKAAAQKVKSDGASNRDAAVILYDAKYPSSQQVKNVSSILRNYGKKTAAKRSLSDETLASGSPEGSALKKS